ncbi:hypothetical protein FRB97_004853, partial [Tulasnella sp. 331]
MSKLTLAEQDMEKLLAIPVDEPPPQDYILQGTGQFGTEAFHEDLVGRLELPTALLTRDDPLSPHILNVVTGQWSGGVISVAFIPDRDRILPKPEDMYNHHVRLFEIASRNRHAKFVHAEYHDSMDSLIQAGVRREIDAFTLVESAITMGQDARERTIGDLRFIPVNGERHDVIKLAEFAQPLPDPDIASPDKLLRTELVLVVWKQRAHPATPSSSLYLQDDTWSSVPTAREVVRHLEALSTEITSRVSLNRSLSLLKGLNLTYHWPSEQKKDAQRRFADGTTSQTWRLAQELMLNPRYDGEYYSVKEFLLPLKDLLIVAGADEEVPLTLPVFQPLLVTHDQRLRHGLDSLRQELMTDIQFEVNEVAFKAHKVVLVVVIDHFNVALTFHENEEAPSARALTIFPMDDITSASVMRSVI